MEELSFDAGFALPEAPTKRALDGARVYDVLVLGGGPAGISAAIYLLRKGLAVGMVTGNVGGQVTWTSSIENYLGYRIVDGPHLVEKFKEQVKVFPFDIDLERTVEGVTLEGGLFTVAAKEGRYRSRALVIATGKRPRQLGVPGEKRLLGHGVAYCAICDAPLYRGRPTAVAGGGNSGLESAIDLARGKSRVTIVERQEHLTGDALLAGKVAAMEGVEILTGHEIVEILGEEKVRAIKVRPLGETAAREIAVEGVFVEIGLLPNSEPFRGFVALNDWGEVEVDCRCATSVPGVYAAGDVTSVPYKQIIIAAGEGAKAALSAYEYLLHRADDDGKGE